MRQQDRMVGRWPDQAEAWNKRATLAACATSSTPRSRATPLGAPNGFGQICLRQDDVHSALLVFERVLH